MITGHDLGAPTTDTSRRYQLTGYGRAIAVFFTKAYVRLLNPSLAELDTQLPDHMA